MNALLKRHAAATLTVLTLLATAHQLAAQPKPVAIVSISSVSEILDDLRHVGELTRNTALMNMQFLAGFYTEGIDTSKSGGALVTMQGESPIITMFIPVKNYDTILLRLEDQLGEGEDAGNGITKFVVQQALFVQERGGYAIASNDKASLKLVPADPSTLSQGFQKQYDVSARIIVKNIPAEAKERWIEQLKEGFALGAEEFAEEIDEQAQEDGVKQISRLLTETEEVSFGVAIDRDKKKSHLDFKFVALEGTKLAEQLAGLYQAQTNFAGFLNEAAAIRLSFSATTPPEDRGQIETLVAAVRDQITQEIDDAEGLGDDDTKAALKKAVSSLLEITEETAKTGIADGGAFVSFKDGKLSAVAGGFVADGGKVEMTVKDLAAAMKKEAAPLNIKFDADTHRDVKIHTLTIPINDDEAQKALGNSLMVAIGTGPKSLFASIGPNAVGNLKQVLDQSQSVKDTKPFFMQARVGDIIKFIATVEDEPILKQMAEKVGEFAGTDRVTIQVLPAERGVRYGIEIQDGVLQLIGEMTPEDEGF